MSNNITETDILKAIDELMAKGIEPTQNKVRDFLGYRRGNGEERLDVG